MDQTTFLLLLVGGLIAIALAFVVASWLHRRRSRFLRQAGRRIGLIPLAAGESFHFTPVPLLRKKGRGIGAALRGTWRGRPIMVFDLFHPVGKSMTMQTVLMIELQEASLPEFAAISRDPRLLPPTMDIRPVEPAPPELNQRWHLYSRNGQWPFGPDLVSWLAQQSRGGWSIEGTGQVIYIYRRSATARSLNLRNWVDGAFTAAMDFAGRASPAGGATG